MRRLRVTLVLVICLLAISTVASAQEIARLYRFGGAIDVIRGGRPQALYLDMPLLNDDIVKTRRGKAIIRFKDGTEVRVRRNSHVAITQTGKRRDIRVLAGRLWAKINRWRDTQTRFRTGGTIAAVRGTIIEWAVDDGSGLVSVGVTEGLLELTFTYPDGSIKKIVLQAGERLDIGADGLPTTDMPQPFHPGDIAAEEGGGLIDVEDQLAVKPCGECGVWDPSTGGCRDMDSLCPDLPCVKHRICRNGRCTGGRHLTSKEDPNCTG